MRLLDPTLTLVVLGSGVAVAFVTGIVLRRQPGAATLISIAMMFAILELNLTTHDPWRYVARWPECLMLWLNAAGHFLVYRVRRKAGASPSAQG